MIFNKQLDNILASIFSSLPKQCFKRLPGQPFNPFDQDFFRQHFPSFRDQKTLDQCKGIDIFKDKFTDMWSSKIDNFVHFEVDTKRVFELASKQQMMLSNPQFLISGSLVSLINLPNPSINLGQQWVTRLSISNSTKKWESRRFRNRKIIPLSKPIVF